MVKLVTPTPDFFENGVNPFKDMPSYDAYAMRKQNRPWLMFSIAPYTSIMVPNRSGAMNENYAAQYNVGTAGGGVHYADAGYDIPNMIVIKGAEHQLVEDWDNLNPDSTERSEILHKNAGKVMQKAQQFIKDFAQFSQQTSEAEYVDELPDTHFANGAFNYFSTAPLQFKQNELPTSVTGLNKPLPEPMPFDDYPKAIKRDYSRLDKYGDPMSYITPLQVQTYNAVSNQNSITELDLKSYFNHSFSNHNDDFATPGKKLEHLEKILADQAEQDINNRNKKAHIQAKTMKQPSKDDNFDLEL